MPQRAQLVLREASTGTNTENLNKAEALTFEELDRNFLGVRDQTFGIVGDDSTGIDVAAGQTITATGTGGITVAVANDTITIDGSGVTGGGGGGDIGNLQVNDTTLSPITTNDDLILTSNGTGDIFVLTDSGTSLFIGENKTNGVWSIGSGIIRYTTTATGSGIIDHNNGGAITLKSVVDSGSLELSHLLGGFVRIGNGSSAGNITSNGAYDLNLSTNDGSSSGTITIVDGADQNIKILPNGTGKIQLDNHYWPNTDGTTGQVLSTNGSGVLSWVDNTAGTTPQGITFVGDDSAGIEISDGGQLYIQGGTGITTSANSDGTITITSSGLLDVVEDTTPQLGGDLDINSNDITGTGNISITGNISTDAISIADNKISTTRSNDDLYVVAAGNGYVQLGKELDASPVSSFADLPYNTGMFAYASGDINASSSSSRFYGHQRILDGTVTTGGTNNLVRSRIIDEVGIDVNGNSWNQGSRGGGAGIIHFITVKNTSDGSTGAINWPQGNNSGILLAPSGTASGSTVNISNMAAYRSVSQNFEQSTDTFAITNNYGYYATPMFDTGPGTVTITNDYSFYADYTNTPRINATNQYAFYSDNDAIANRLGGINLQNDQIQAADTNDDLKIAENGTGKVNMVVSTQGSAGTVAGYMKIKVNGTDYVVPYHNLS